ncbi:hypothetical protein ACZ91_29945 [Streptomyces regensis]|nr:hypothetical protein ACZ91_29945 [Streptomyces regensis]
MRAARAQAALSGRDFVVPDDLHAVAVPVLAHRLVLTTEAQAARRSPADVVRSVLQRLPVPQRGTVPGASGSGVSGSGVSGNGHRPQHAAPAPGRPGGSAGDHIGR